ncbi:hypothetical protein AMIS_68940 [Actinoplanes missouriensis 431]|uniref:Uncharacterized protein n=1 Tax=Actinoplanes missouriensis (strain ATCC 14538 / DSM 43046 / CBS 188.64 / JCM 3121 / NBRC 102363 / NCIMB 12654 / NRRL B-3342 / UNCC 431) TaxID=512565 RepID=I0HGH7_ACTM4|nr:hypothetical protein [Actinoplanes missouriensis]BAL92114.1 hypothetical protein AMIS_68940 [Actinoplanes missouriensis 431]
MRRLVFSIIVAMGFVMVGSSSASAEDPTPAPTVSAKATPGKKLCKIVDKRLDEISGLVATDDGYVAIDDGTTDEAKRKIFFLNKKCVVTKEQEYSGDGPKDPEDMVLSADGKTIWIADIGDNAVRTEGADPRKAVAVWKMPADGGKKPTLYRMTYPGGDNHDAEALLIDGDGLPLVITKEIGATAGVYKPSAALVAKSTAGVPMTKVADLKVNATETAGNALARIGNKTITGGAVAPGGAKVVLRTYTDALEWDVENGDVVAALKKEPRTTGLPNEPFGEAISYSPDGKSFITVSDMNGDLKVANNIREYTPATEVAAISKKSGQDSSGAAWYTDLDNLTYLVAGVGGLGLLLVAAGVFGIVRFRKSPRATAASEADDLPGGLNTADPETELIGVGGLPQRAPAYGRPGGGAGPVYGGAQAGPPPGAPGPQRGGNGVYGGAPAGAPAGAAAGGGGQYGRPAGQQPPRGPQQVPPRGPQQGGGPRGPQQGGPKQGGPKQGSPKQGGPKQGGPRGPQQQPRGPQQVPPRGPQQGGGPRGPQQGGPQQGGPRGPQQQPRGPQQGGGPRGPQQGGAGPRGPQQVPPRGPQQGGPRGPQQPPRGPKPPSGRGGGGGGVYGGGGGRPDDR